MTTTNVLDTTTVKAFYQVRSSRWATKARKAYAEGNTKDALYYQGKARRWARHAREA